MKKIEYEDFSSLFGGTPDEIKNACGDFISKFSWEYEILNETEKDKIILAALKKIDSPELKSSGVHRENDWEDGWGENLEEFISSGYDLKTLAPKYFKQNVPVRLLGKYVLPSDPDFTFNITHAFRMFVFHKFLKNHKSIYEFGCGTGHHLAAFASECPDKKYYGFDWAKSSQKIISLMAEKFKWNIKGSNLDFFNPDQSIVFDEDSVVMTFGALEQIGNRHTAYLDFILQRKPALCVDIAGIHELYDTEDLFDYVALKYHKRRNYLDSYLTRLYELEKNGIIKILQVHRQKFGNLWDDPHSYVIWKTL